MNTQQLESFLILCKEMHYGKAAERLSISQPSLSQKIKAMEKYLGVTLFVKEGRNIALSKAGEVFLQHALNIHNTVTAAKQDMRYFQEQEIDKIRLGVSGSHLLVGAFEEFTEAFPDKALVISEHPSIITTKMVHDGHLELGIVYDNDEIYELSQTVLFDDELILAIPKGHELCGVKNLKLKDLDNQQMILLSKNLYLRKVIDYQFKKYRIVPNIICELDNNYACLEYSKNQLGITFTTLSLIRSDDYDSFVFRRFDDPGFIQPVKLIYRSEVKFEKPIKHLIDIITSNHTKDMLTQSALELGNEEKL